MKLVKQAVILAGGMGMRLRPLTFTKPKPMIPILGKPFLTYLLELLKNNGIEEVILLVGYLHRQIEDYFGNGEKFDLTIRYVYDPPGADTGVRVKHASPLLKKHFLLLYGDNYWSLKLDQLVDYYNQKKCEALVTVYNNIDKITKNNMFVNPAGLVELYDRTRTNKQLNCVDIGFFLLNKKVLSYLPKQNFSFEQVIIPRLIQRKQLFAYLTNHRYYSLTNLDRIPAIQRYFLSRKVVFLDRDGVINKRPAKANYVTNWDKFNFLPKSLAALKCLMDKGYEIYIVSNQAGIFYKKMSLKQVNNINKRLRHELIKEGIKIIDIAVCPHGWDEGCFCRKPNPGLFFKLASIHNINLYLSVCIGDDIRDIEAGQRAGCKTILLGEKKIINSNEIVKPDYLAIDLYQAVDYL